MNWQLWSMGDSGESECNSNIHKKCLVDDFGSNKFIFRCIGGQQHLKSKFGKGVEIEVQLPEGGRSSDVTSEIIRRMPFLQVKEVNQVRFENLACFMSEILVIRFLPRRNWSTAFNFIQRTSSYEEFWCNCWLHCRSADIGTNLHRFNGNRTEVDLLNSFKFKI